MSSANAKRLHSGRSTSQRTAMPMSRKSPAMDPAAVASSLGEPAAAAAEAARAPPPAVGRIRQTARDLVYRERVRGVGGDENVTRPGATKASRTRNVSSEDEVASA